MTTRILAALAAIASVLMLAGCPKQPQEKSLPPDLGGRIRDNLPADGSPASTPDPTADFRTFALSLAPDGPPTWLARVESVEVAADGVVSVATTIADNEFAHGTARAVCRAVQRWVEHTGQPAPWTAVQITNATGATLVNHTAVATPC